MKWFSATSSHARKVVSYQVPWQFDPTSVSVVQARAAVLTASQCATYNEAKQAVMSLTGGGDTMATHVGASMVSGLVTTTLTAPVDVIKTNMFVGDLLITMCSTVGRPALHLLINLHSTARLHWTLIATIIWCNICSRHDWLCNTGMFDLLEEQDKSVDNSATGCHKLFCSYIRSTNSCLL